MEGPKNSLNELSRWYNDYYFVVTLECGVGAGGGNKTSIFLLYKFQQEKNRDNSVVIYLFAVYDVQVDTRFACNSMLILYMKKQQNIYRSGKYSTIQQMTHEYKWSSYAEQVHLAHTIAITDRYKLYQPAHKDEVSRHYYK